MEGGCGVRGGRPAFCFLVACLKRHLKESSRLNLEEPQKRVRLNKGYMGKGKGYIRATFETIAGSWSTKGGCKTCPAVPKLAKKKEKNQVQGTKTRQANTVQPHFQGAEGQGGQDEDMAKDRREGHGWKLTFLLLLFATATAFTPKNLWPQLALTKEDKEVKHSKVVVRNDGRGDGEPA